MTTAKIL